MKFSLWTQYGAINSKLVFDAFAGSLRDAGHDVSFNSMDADVAVIWSVLWNGRMSGNKKIWEHFRSKNKPVIVLEVGGINRGITWKVGLNGVNRDAFFTEAGNTSDRANAMGLSVNPWKTDGEFILICTQHTKSLQWGSQPDINKWLDTVITDVRKYSSRPILVRPHPRCAIKNINGKYKNVYQQTPALIKNSYDDYDINFDNIHAVVNWSSNPGPQAIMAGVPAFVGTSSIAYAVGNDIDFMHDIDTPLMPDRTQWINDYAWTEYSLDEISNGMPLNNLTSNL
jgi:hypothetical protein